MRLSLDRQPTAHYHTPHHNNTLNHTTTTRPRRGLSRGRGLSPHLAAVVGALRAVDGVGGDGGAGAHDGDDAEGDAPDESRLVPVGRGLVRLRSEINR